MPMMDATSRPLPQPSHGRSHDQGVGGDRHAREPDVAAAVQSHTLATFGLSQSGLRETLHPPARRPDGTDRDDAAKGIATATALPRDPRDVEALQSLAALSALAAAQQQQQQQQQQQLLSPTRQPSGPSEEESQASTNTATSDSVFTPPASQNDTIRRPLENGDSSSQESQLFQLSQLAAARDKMDASDATAPSRKRMADGEVKDTNMSPVRGGHSRNTSTVSVASTTTSTIGEVSGGGIGGAASVVMSQNTDAGFQLSSDLKTRLSYAMVKLNHGWQSHSIDEVESMASQAVSPTSTNSTLPGRTASSASPRLAVNGRNGPASATTPSSNPSPATYESFWRDNAHPTRRGHNSASPPSSAQNGLTLAPPVTIQPAARPLANPRNPRRNSNPHYTPTLLSHSQSASPQTPAQSSYRGPPRPGARNVDPVLFSPHQNVREQDAAESLLFMSSPGNSGNMKHGYVPAGLSSSQPLPGRHALPTSQPRKGLPSGKPTPKRVGFEMSPSSVSDMDIDGSPQVRTPRGLPARRRINGGSFAGPYSPGHRGHLSLPTGLGGGHGRSRPQLADEEIERMLDRVVQGDNDSSDDEEIQIPPRREGAGIVG